MRRLFKDRANQPSRAAGDEAGDEAGVSGRGRKRYQIFPIIDQFSRRISSRGKSVDGGSRFHPSHNRATSVPATHEPRTPSDANDTPGPELSPDAADTSFPAESVSRLEDLTRIDIPTGQEHPVSQGSHEEPITPQGLWDEAYDKLKGEQPELMKGYETILSNMLRSPDDPDDLGQVTIKTTSDDRRAQLLDVIRSSQKKIEKEGKIKENIGQILSVISSLNSTIQTAIQAAPQAALPWSIVSLSLEVIQNPIKDFEKNIEGLTYVTARMDWYWNLADSLLRGGECTNDSKASNMQDAMCSRLVELYKELLAFQIKSICSFHRNRGLAFLRDMAKLDDWESNLQAVRTLELGVQGDYTTYTNLQQSDIGRQTRDLLQELVRRQPQELGPQAKQCLQDLNITDPRLDRDRIISTKGGLLQASYEWILEDSTVRHWRQERQKSLLWIKGDPGKGKTMMLCGLSQELEDAKEGPSLLSYFFCQATVPTLNTATAVLRGLLYLLVIRHPSLFPHLQDAYEEVGDRKVFEGVNSWFALVKIFNEMMQDQLLQNSCFIIDALDECSDRDKLLDLIVDSCASTPGVKWILSSRKIRDIEAKLGRCEHSVVVDLEEHNDSTIDSVNMFIESRLQKLHLVEDNPILQEKLRDIILKKSNRTFLWAALVIEELKNLETYEEEREVLQFLDKMPSGLPELYDRMIAQIKQMGSKLDRDQCFRILSTMATTYRPLTLTALPLLADLKGNLAKPETLRKLIQMCGSFLTIQDQTIYFIHQSARDYLVRTGTHVIHRDIYSRSVEALKSQGGLRANIYALTYPGAKIEEISPPHPDPLEQIQYSCVYWLQHFCDSVEASKAPETKAIEKVYTFLQQHLLHWFEALSLLKSLQAGILSLQRLLTLSTGSDRFSNFFQDACRFCIHSRYIIETAPLQVYVSALIFSPRQNEIRQHFQSALSWIKRLPDVGDDWDSCLFTLEGHKSGVVCTAFSDDSRFLASSAYGGPVRVWDPSTGDAIHVFPTEQESGVQFSDNCKWLASISYAGISVWDIETGICRYNSDLFAYRPPISSYLTWKRSLIPIWNTTTGELVEKLPLGLDELCGTVCALSNGSTYLARQINLGQVQITSSLTGDVIHSLQGFVDKIVDIVFSPNSEYLALYYKRGFAQVWHITEDDAILMPGTYCNVGPVGFSHDSKLVSFGYDDGSVKVWNLEDATELQLHIGHIKPVNWVAFSKDSKLLATASNDSTIKIWTTTTAKQNLPVKDYRLEEKSIALSDDGKLTATGNTRGTIEIWDKQSSQRLETVYAQTISGYPPLSAFSRDCRFLVIAARSEYSSFFIDVRTLGRGPDPGIHLPQDPKNHKVLESIPISMAFSPDSTCIIVAHESPQPRILNISVWDIHKREWVQTLRGPRLSQLALDRTFRLYLTDTYLYLRYGKSVCRSAKKNPESGQFYGPLEQMAEPSDCPYIAYTYESGEGWVSWNGKDMIWIPTGFRPQGPWIGTWSSWDATSSEILIESSLRGSLSFAFEEPPADLADWTPWKSSNLFKEAT